MPADRERHTIYLSDLVWAELRKNAILQPGYDASRIVEYLLDDWMEKGAHIDAPLRRQHSDTVDTPSKRTLFLRPGLWQAVSERAQAGNYSISMLIESLLRRYLNVEIE